MPLFQRFQKVIKNVFKIMKPHLCSRPCMILKRPNENCSRCNLKLLYIIPLFQNFKNPPTIYETIKCIYTIEEPHIISKQLNETRRKRCIQHLPYIIPLFQKCKKYKNRPIVKRSKSQADDIILDACMRFERYPIKTVGEDAYYSYYISYNYFKISKLQTI